MALIGALVPASVRVVAGETACPWSRHARAYEVGAAALARGDATAAAEAWRPLARLGYAPALSQMGRLYAGGDGVDRNAVRAYVFLKRAAAEDERLAAEALGALDARLTSEERARAEAAFAASRPEVDGCLGRALDDPAMRPLADVQGGFTYRGLVLLAEDAAEREGARRIIDAVLARSPANLLYLQYPRAILVKDTVDGVLAFVSKDVPYLGVSGRYATDADAGAVAEVVLGRLRRLLYARSSGVAYADPLERRYRGMVLVGSDYLDADNAPFFEQLPRAIDMVGDLTPELREYVGLITRIFYDPPSRFKRSRSSENAAYLPSADPERERIVFITKNLRLSGAPAVLARSLVHEGTHAAQHLRDFRAHAGIAAKLALARRRAGDGACGECRRLEGELAAAEDTMALWNNPARRHGNEFVQRFECEAALNGLKAVEQLGLGRSAGGPYASVCADVDQRRWALPEDRLRPPVPGGFD